MDNIEDLNEYKKMKELLSFKCPKQIFETYEIYTDFMKDKAALLTNEDRALFINLLMEFIQIAKKYIVIEKN